MYHPSMDFLGGSGMVLIPTRFVWPYGGGGKVMFISGTFTGWTQWPMTPVELCPTLFQTICSLPQGFHQALQYRDDPFSTHGYNNQRCQMCLQSDPFHKG